MFDFRKKAIIIALAVAGLILAAVLAVKFYSPPKTDIASGGEEQAAGETTEGGVSGDNQPAAQGQTATPAVKAGLKQVLPSAEVYVKQLASLFVERFFSYSNQNDNQHIEDAAVLATDNMSKWVRTQGLDWSSEYQGSIAKVVASSVKEISANKAVVIVDFQQSFEGKEQKTVYQSGKVELVKSGGEWRVDGAYFEK